MFVNVILKQNIHLNLSKFHFDMFLWCHTDANSTAGAQPLPEPIMNESNYTRPNKVS